MRFRDEESAVFAKSGLSEFIRLLQDQLGVEKLHIIAEGMGARPLIGVVEDWKPDAYFFAPTRVGQLLFLAPDISRELFIERLAPARGVAERITLYVASTMLSSLPMDHDALIAAAEHQGVFSGEAQLA